jgi:hypothetical protein
MELYLNYDFVSHIRSSLRLQTDSLPHPSRPLLSRAHMHTPKRTCAQLQMPSAGCPYPHMRLLRALLAALVGIAAAPPRRFFTVGPADLCLGGSGGTPVNDLEGLVHPDSLPPGAGVSQMERSAVSESWSRGELRRGAFALIQVRWQRVWGPLL